MPIYNADQIIDKTLFAKTEVPLKRIPDDAAPVAFVVKPGMRVGEVYSWLDVKPGTRKNLWWMFYDQNRKPYYAEQIEGRFNVEDLKEQGALTVKEQIEAERKKNQSLKETILNTLKTAGIGLAVVMIAKSFIETRKK